MKPSISISEYRDNFGFGLKNIFTIYESKKSHYSGNDWFAFPDKTLETLFTVQEESKGDLLVVYIVETIKNNRVHCHLILRDEAFKVLRQEARILKIHQMYHTFFKDHLVMNRSI